MKPYIVTYRTKDTDHESKEHIEAKDLAQAALEAEAKAALNFKEVVKVRILE